MRGGRQSARRFASMLSQEEARCSASEVHALNEKLSAFFMATERQHGHKYGYILKQLAYLTFPHNKTV